MRAQKALDDVASNICQARHAGRFAKALSAADGCIAEEGAWAKGHFRRGQALARLQEVQRARAAFAAAAAADPEDTEVAAALADLERQEVEATRAAAAAAAAGAGGTLSLGGGGEVGNGGTGRRRGLAAETVPQKKPTFGIAPATPVAAPTSSTTAAVAAAESSSHSTTRSAPEKPLLITKGISAFTQQHQERVGIDG